jgi:hydroxyethylthiazole kinase-like sugar kinase family protein
VSFFVLKGGIQMLTTIVGIGCFISGGLLGATIMAILVVAKHSDQVSEALGQQENNN